MSVSVREVNSLEEIAPAWQSLWEQCPGATPFDSPAWLLSWHRHLGHGEAWPLAFEEAGRLVGLAPLFVYTEPASGLRRVLFLGTSVTDLMNVLCAPGYEQVVVAALAAHLAQHAGRWDVADFQEVIGGPLRECSPIGLERHECVCAVRPVIALPATVEEFHASLGGGLRRNLRRYRERLGEMQFEASASDELMQAFFDLHKSRWKDRIESMIDQPRVERFHCAAMHALRDAGLLRLYGLRRDAEVVAVIYAMAAHGRVYCYLGGFRPDLANCSPGSLIMNHAIEQAIIEGMREWDFLRGAESYKYMWGAADQQNYRVRWKHPGSPANAFND